MRDNGRSLLAAVARDGSAAALVDGDRSFTYAELEEVARRFAAGLGALGLGRGDRLLVIMQNRAEMAVAYWATQLSGIVFTPINWRTKAGELAFFIEDSGARAILYDASAREAVELCSRAQALMRITTDDLIENETSLDRHLTAPASREADCAHEGDLSLLLYTSGTTGRPKGVPRTHRAERAAALAHVAQNTYRSGEVTLGVMPLYHTMGIRLLLAATLLNGLFVCQHRFDPRTSLDLIERHRVSALYLVPTLYHDLLAERAVRASDVSSVRKLGFAGAPMSDGLLRRLDEVFRPELFVNHYGSSEVYTFTVNQTAPAKPGSAGKAGINAEIRVIPVGSLDIDERSPIGEVGQVIASLASEEAFESYWRQPEADSSSLRDGWYITGDLGFLDLYGDLFVAGRVDDMIISGGENITPTEVESVLSLHPGVADVAVAGVPDERLGQLVVEFVIRAGDVSVSDLEAWCRQSDLADFKRPRAYEFPPSLPRSPVGKLLRRALVASKPITC